MAFASDKVRVMITYDVWGVLLTKISYDIIKRCYWAYKLIILTPLNVAYL